MKRFSCGLLKINHHLVQHLAVSAVLLVLKYIEYKDEGA